MTDSIVEAFDALAAMVPDEIWAARFRQRVASALTAKEGDRPALLAAAYADGEREVMRASGGTMREETVRAKLAPLFAKLDDRYPGLALLLAQPDRQFLDLANRLIVGYARVWARVAGKAVTEKSMRDALTGTPWERVKTNAESGIAPDGLLLRGLGDLTGAVSRLLEGWYEKAPALIGREANRVAFENAFRKLEARYGFLPAFKSLLGATPLRTLGHEKARRLHELENETSLQARDIRTAESDIRHCAAQQSRTSAELEETRRKLEAVSQARSEFIDVVSHQFRTPLSSIRWSAEMLADGAEKDLAPEHREALESIRAKSVYLIETLDRVFATLDIDTGTMVLDIKSGFFWEAAQDVVESCRKDLERKGIKLKFARSKAEPEPIPFDRAKIAAVLRIVIGNAVSYGREGGTLQIEMGEQVVNGLPYQCCTVTDDGVGLSKDDAGRIMEKFFRSKSAVLKSADGTGLGMYIAKNYVEAHRGILKVESDGPGRGVSVTIALPIR